jgi:hypothetical protein
MEAKATFGRRSGKAEAPVAQDNSGSGSGSRSRLTAEQRASLRTVLWATPLIAILIGLPIMLAKLSDADCRSKPAAERGIFDINWCQAGLAAVRGAAQGVAMGAGRSR